MKPLEFLFGGEVTSKVEDLKNYEGRVLEIKRFVHWQAGVVEKQDSGKFFMRMKKVRRISSFPPFMPLTPEAFGKDSVGQYVSVRVPNLFRRIRASKMPFAQ